MSNIMHVIIKAPKYPTPTLVFVYVFIFSITTDVKLFGSILLAVW